LENANALDPILTDLHETLGAFVRLEGIQTEYGPGQVETNLIYTDALEAADDSARLKYAAKEVARRHGKIASFMPKPFSEHSGSSAHLHISLWRDGQPAFGSEDGNESEVALHAIAGLLEHLPSITLFGAHSVNAYRRFVPDSFAPATVTWSRDNRSAAVRSLIEATPEATRIELRTGGSDANPYWLTASALAAVVAGLEAGRRPPLAEGGNLYGSGIPLPESLGVAVALATRDDTIADILGVASVQDFAAIANSEWIEYNGHVSDWERQRYLTRS
jgi:glutamine synthetase